MDIDRAFILQEQPYPLLKWYVFGRCSLSVLKGLSACPLALTGLQTGSNAMPDDVILGCSGQKRVFFGIRQHQNIFQGMPTK